MTRREYLSRQRRTVCSVESLDDRTLMTVALLAPVTVDAPVAQVPPAASPFNPVTVHRLETGLSRIAVKFENGSHKLDNLFSNRVSGFRVQFENTVNRDAALVNSALGSTNASGGKTQLPSLANFSSTFATQFGQFTRSFTSQLNQLETSLQRQFGTVASRFQQANSQFAIPIAAFQNNLQAAQTQFSGSLNNALATVTTAFQTGFNSLGNTFTGVAGMLSQSGNGVIGSGTTGITGLGSTGIGSGTGTTGLGTTGTGTTIGVIPSQTEIFNNAFTQAFSSFDTAIGTIGTTLQADFSPLLTSFTTNNSGFMSTLTTTPFGTFTPVIGFLPGNGGFVTTTGSLTPTTPTTPIGTSTPTTPIGTTTPTTPGNTGIGTVGTGTTGTGTTGTGTTGTGTTSGGSLGSGTGTTTTGGSL